MDVIINLRNDNIFELCHSQGKVNVLVLLLLFSIIITDSVFDFAARQQQKSGRADLLSPRAVLRYRSLRVQRLRRLWPCQDTHEHVLHILLRR